MATNPPTMFPHIHIEIIQPGNRGPFQVRVSDPQHQHIIHQHQLPENLDNMQFLYTANLLENRDDLHAKEGDWRKRDRRAELARYGQKLYRDLFGEGQHLQQYLKRLPSTEQGVHFNLRLHTTASELWNVPWEYVHDGRQFMAIEGNHLFVRSLLGANLKPLDGQLKIIPRPLRILVVLAEPEEVPPLNMELEISNMLRAMDAAQRKNLVNVDFVEEGSLENVQAMLGEDEYHVLHYIGHGAMSDKGGFLALEDAFGEIKPVFMHDLLPVIQESASLRLVVLNGCQTGQIDETRAMSGLATGLLQAVPAVAAMQFSILDQSSLVFTQSFYSIIGSGGTLEQALHAARLAMNKANAEAADWGLPALYLRSNHMRLVNPKAPPVKTKRRQQATTTDLPMPTLFVGRRKEQRALRRALADPKRTTAYIWGVGGVGKSTLLGRLVQRPGRKDLIEDVFVIRCHDGVAAEIPNRLARALELNGHASAAGQLRTPRIPYDERVRRMAKSLHEHRFIFAIDNFESVLEERGGQWVIPDPDLDAFFRGLVTVTWNSLTIFTSRYRWSYLDELSRNSYSELPLKSLGIQEAIMLIRQLPRLQHAPIEQQITIVKRIGGHPHTLHLLDGYLAHHSLDEVLKNDQFSKEMSRNWEEHFLRDLLKRLRKGERRALASMTVVVGALWAERVRYMADLDELETAQDLLDRWEALSLVQYEHMDLEGTHYYTMHPIVRTAIGERLKPEVRNEFHLRAGRMASRIFVHLAWEHYHQNGGLSPEEDAFKAARLMIRNYVENADLPNAQGAMNQALMWRYHLYEAGDYEGAGSLTNDTWFVLANRWGETELARRLLQESIDTLSGINQTIARTNMANLMMSDGEEEEALKIYKEVEKVFKKRDDLQSQLAVVYSNQARIYRRRNDLKRALKYQLEALKIDQDSDNKHAEASSLLDLCILYIAQGDYKKAMQFNKIGEHLARHVGDVSLVASFLHERGRIHTIHRRYQEAFACFSTTVEMAQHSGNLFLIASCLSEMGNVLRLNGQTREAGEMMLQALEISRQLGDPKGVANKLMRLGLIYEELRNYQEALEMLQQAYDLYKQYGSKDDLQYVRGLQERIRRSGRL